jgi:hypothetical protein
MATLMPDVLLNLLQEMLLKLAVKERRYRFQSSSVLPPATRRRPSLRHV